MTHFKFSLFGLSASGKGRGAYLAAGLALAALIGLGLIIWREGASLALLALLSAQAQLD